MVKDLKLSAEAANMAKNTKAYIIIHTDTKGHATMSVDGNAMEVCFMKEALQDFVLRLIRGEVQLNPN